MIVSGVLKSLLFLALLFVPLLYLPRLMQREIQAIFLLITRRPEISTALFSLLFLPGVLLHETSHFIMAHLLGVKTGGFSIIPRRLEGGRLQLGYVETVRTDFFRDAIIGAAPLIVGCIFVAFAGLSRMGLNTVWDSLVNSQANIIKAIAQAIASRTDFWLWFYLTFTVSSTMMPSASDRKAWLPLMIFIILLFGLILLIGAGSWLLTNLGDKVKAGLDAVDIVFGITTVIHLVLLLPAYLLRKIISRIVGYQVVS